MGITREDIETIALRTAEEVMTRIRETESDLDILHGTAAGPGAIPLYGRENRQEPCDCCLINPGGPDVPENRMCTTKGAIGILSNREEREWCSEINVVADGRCQRARSIREAAAECREKYPADTQKFFECFAPAFGRITEKKGSNPTKLKSLKKDDVFVIGESKFRVTGRAARGQMELERVNDRQLFWWDEDTEIHFGWPGIQKL